MKKYFKFSFYLLATIIVIIFLLEDACQLYVRFLNPELMPKYEQQQNPDYINFLQTTRGKFKASPYFGYVAIDGNNYGFYTKENFPLKRNVNTYVIAILGGSVANHLANTIFKDPGYVKKIKSQVFALKDKDIRFMGLALPGYKQPQQFFVLSYFLDQIDMVIQLDGWNEVSVTAPNDHPADYPMWINFNSNQTKFFQMIEGNKLLNMSMALFLFKNSLEFKTAKNAWKKTDQAFDPNHKIHIANTSQLISTWSKFIQLEKDLLKANNKKGFFFVQASQYNEKSKVLTVHEKKIAFNPIRLKIGAPGFQLLRAEAKKINVFDLAEVFKNESESIYVDDCCHVNERGNKLVSDEILRVIAIKLNN